MVLFLNKKKLQEQKPLVNNTYQGKYDYSKMQYLPEDQRFGFDTLVKETGVLPETAYMLGRVESNDSFKPDLIGYNDKSDIGVLQLNENAAVKDILQMRYNDKGEEIGSYWDMIAKRNLKEYEELDLKKAVHSYLGAAAYIRLLKQRLNTEIGRATDEDVLFAYRMGASGYINDIKKGIASDLLKERYKHLVQKGYEPSFTIDKDGKIIKKENKLSLLQRITPTAEASEVARDTNKKSLWDIFSKKPKMVFPVGEGMSEEETKKAKEILSEEDLAVKGYREGSFFTRPTAGFYDPMASGFMKDTEIAQQTLFSQKSTREEKIEAFDFLMQPIISASQPLESASGKIPTTTPKGKIKSSVLKIFAKEKNPLSIERSLRQMGIDDINAKSLSFDLAKANTADEVGDALVAFSNKPLSIASKSGVDDVASGVAKQATSISDDLAELAAKESPIPKALQHEDGQLKQVLTSVKETPIEYGLGKGVMQEKIISNETSKLDDLLNKAKITKEDSIELFNAFDNPKKYALSPSLKSRGGDEIIKEGKKLNKFLSKEKLSRNIIDRIYDDDTYLRTVLETTDGGKPTAEQIARLKNATNQTFRDQLAGDLTGFSGKLREKIKTNARIYRTADERDIVLESFGLRTKRDFVNSMSENLRISTRAISNKEFNDSVRSIAKQGFWVKGGKLVKRDDIIEAYDPINVAKTRQEIRNKTSKKISNILDEIKKERILTENEAKMITNTIYEQKEEVIKELKDSQRYALDDIDNIINYTKQRILSVRDTLLKEKALLLDKKVKLFEEIREEARRELNNYYGKITIKRGELIDKGFKDAGSINGAEALRGVMLNKKDHKALSEFVTELGESSLEDFAKTIKYFQATLDLFQIPQLIRSSISSSGFIKGTWDWLKAIVKSSGVSVDDMIKSSEFVQQGRFKDFDIDVWNKQIKDLNENTSWFMRQFKKLGKKTDNIPVIRNILNGISSLDEYQFQTVMIPLKTKAWLRKVDEFKRLYPNMDERSLMVEAGRFIDDYFGGQQWDKLMARNPRLASRQNQRISRIMIFATDYLTSTMRKLKRETFDAFTKWGVPEGNAARKALVREIIFGLGLVNAISYMTRGKSSFENDDPNQFYKIQTDIKDGSGNPYYLDAMGNWGQTWNLINRPIDAIRGKISGIGKIGLSFLADGEIKIGEALNPIPFSWRNIVETIYNHAMGRKPEAQIPETIGGGALLTTMEFMGLAGTFSGGKSRRQTIMRMVESESFTPEEVWKYLTGQNVFTNRERITRMIEKDGISDAYSWELEQKKKGYLSEDSYPTRDALKLKYGISGSVTSGENIKKINGMTKKERSIFIKGYSEKTQEAINSSIKNGTTKSLSSIFK
jgi:hypothetical protein